VRACEPGAGGPNEPCAPPTDPASSVGVRAKALHCGLHVPLMRQPLVAQQDFEAARGGRVSEEGVMSERCRIGGGGGRARRQVKDRHLTTAGGPALHNPRA